MALLLQGPAPWSIVGSPPVRLEGRTPSAARTMPRLTGPFHGRQYGADSKRPTTAEGKTIRRRFAPALALVPVRIPLRCMRRGKQWMELARTPLSNGRGQG